MQTVILSADFQVTLPPDLCRALNLHSGQEIQLVRYGERIELIPVKSIREMRGFLRGIDTDVPREADRV